MFSRRYLLDLAERVVATGAETGVGVLTSAAFVARDGASWSELGITVGVAMLIATVKALAARQVGSSQSASLVPSVH